MREEDFKEKLKEIAIPEELDDRIKAAIKEEASQRKENKFLSKKRIMLIAATFLLGILMIQGYKHVNKELIRKEIDNDKQIVLQKKLPTIDSKEKFLEIAKIEEATNWAKYTTKSKEDTSSAKMEFSSTNNQVEGVDEMDIIKTDGKYIFSTDRFGENNYIYITDTSNPKDLQKISTIEVKETIRGLFLYNNNLIVIKYENYGMYYNESKIDIYDYSNPKEVRLKKEIAVNGVIEESRLIGDELILVSIDYINHDGDGDPIYNPPYIKENGVKTEKSLKDIKYCPGFKSDAFMNVININLKDFKIGKSETMLVNQGNIYVSKENMYLTNYDYTEDTSLIYKLSIKGEVKFVSEGKVKGKTLNQFSMDEFNGLLRIALTERVEPKDDKVEKKEESAKNSVSSSPNTISSVVVLDNNMKEIGRLEGLGKGEIIHSARFVEDKAYVVTFKRTDPLYIVDMSNPKDLRLLEELKIPGVSKYLHPIDDKTLIGFGEDRDDVNYEGLKVSMFSVEGEAKELHNLLLKKSRSPVIYDHKGFFYSSKHNLMAFEISNDYSKVEDQKRSVEVYKVDRENGFSKIMSIPIEFKEYDARTLYINDGLYIVARSTIKAFNINTFEKVDEIRLDKK